MVSHISIIFPFLITQKLGDKALHKLHTLTAHTNFHNCRDTYELTTSWKLIVNADFFKYQPFVTHTGINIYNWMLHMEVTHGSMRS
jgi:hypothetical protein